ncbi:MAG: tetratricopeptide repeat protein [Candidatus Thorarchaeota archaeon]
MFPDQKPEKLLYAEKLLDNGDIKESLKIIVNYEKESRLTPKEKVWLLLLRGWIYQIKGQIKEAEEAGEQAYQLSKEIEIIPESVESLLIKTNFLKHPDEGLELLSKAEESLSSIPKEQKNIPYKLEIDVLSKKALCYFVKGKLTMALEMALKSLKLAEKIKYRISTAYNLQLISIMYAWTAKHEKALEYAMKSLEYMEKMDLKQGIASSFCQIAHAYNSKGDLNKVVEFCEKSLAINEITNQTKVNALMLIGTTYVSKGELDLALDNLNKAVQLAEEISSYESLAGCLNAIGGLYLTKANYNKALDYFNRSLIISQETGTLLHSLIANFYLFWLNFEFLKNFKQAVQELESLRELTDQTHGETVFYVLAKALMLKKKKRSRDRVEAENLLKKIAENAVEGVSFPQIYVQSLITLCDFLLEELEISNDPEVMDEITSVIKKLLELAERQHSYSIIAMINLFQGRLALINLNLNDARQFLTLAQKIADENGIILLAQKISQEHDKLLEQIEMWESFKKTRISISKRMKLAAVDSVMERMLGKRAIEAPELVTEEPVLLLIITEGGIPALSNPFIEDWSYEEGFISNFLSAFNTFSEEVFAKGLDRAKFGEYTIITKPMGFFSVCYLFKGQSYLAKQKLARFIERVENNAYIWEIFKNFHKTHQTILLSENPPLDNLITEIFIKK